MSEFTQTVEACPTGAEMQQRLRDARWEFARQSASKEMRQLMGGADMIAQPSADFIRVSEEDRPWFTVINPKEQIALEAVGIDVAAFLKDDDVTELPPIEGEGASVQLKKDRRDVFYLLSRGDDGVARNPAEFALQQKQISGRYEKSPGHQALHDALGPVWSEELLPDEISLRRFNIFDDPLGSVVLLNSLSLGVQDSHQYMQAVKKGMTSEDALRMLIESAEGTRVENDDFVRLTWKSHVGSFVSQTLFLDKHTNECTITVRQLPEEAYVETANQAKGSKSRAFIDTECAKEVLEALSSQGLMLSPDIQKEIISVSEADRYGSVYTQMSREIAKWVDSPARLKARNLFLPYDEEFFGANAMRLYNPRLEYEARLDQDGGVQDVENRVRKALTEIDTTGIGEAAHVLLEMAREAVTRQDFDTELQVTKDTIEVTNAACFDVASAYIDAAAQPVNFEGAVPFDENGVPMLKKTSGGKSYLLLQPTRFNGVTLPKGSLMVRVDGPSGYAGGDEGWAFVRLTPFTFDNPADREATGSEIVKTVNYKKDSIAKIGGIGLSNVVAGAEFRRLFGAKN